MKALFLVWLRSGKSLPDFYEFVPYMYGPCSFELYRQLDIAKDEELIAQPPHAAERWAPYFLTEKGRRVAEALAGSAPPRLRHLVWDVADEVASLTFNDLLRRVYREAPEFASQSVVVRELRQ